MTAYVRWYEECPTLCTTRNNSTDQSTSQQNSQPVNEDLSDIKKRRNVINIKFSRKGDGRGGGREREREKSRYVFFGGESIKIGF